MHLRGVMAAQKMRPNSFVRAAGCGGGGTGYIPIEKYWDEKDGNLGDWCWGHPGVEKLMIRAMRKFSKRPHIRPYCSKLWFRLPLLIS